MKKIISICLLAALLLCGCGGPAAYVPTGDGLFQDSQTDPVPTQPQQPQDQTITLGYYPDHSLNPYTSTEIAHKLIFSLVYQGLFVVDDQYNVSPMLCKNFSISKDHRTYVFYPEKATFADGTPVTTADIVASLEAAKASPVYAGRLRQIDSISATEDGGVEIICNTPYENLPLLLDIPIVKADETDAPMPTGTGPYRYEMGMMGLQLQRRDNWWCRANLPISAPSISLLRVDKPATMRDDFELDNISIVCADPGSDTYVDYRCDYELWDVESGYFLYLACCKNSKIFSNATVRAALTHAIDRDLLVTEYYRDFAMSAYLPASPQSPGYSASLAVQYGYAPEKFQQALEEAAFEDMNITLLVNSADSRRVRAARAIADMLAVYGFTVTVDARKDSSYTYALRTQIYDLHLGQTKLSANMDLSAFFDPDGALSYGGLADAASYVLAQGALENSANIPHLYKRVMSNGMLCPILFRTQAIYVQRGLLETLNPATGHIFYYSLGRTMESAKI